MELLKRINEMAQERALSPDHQEVAQRLAAYWSEHGANMTDNELSEAIAMDMDNVSGIEGDPAVIDMLVPIVLKMARGG